MVCCEPERPGEVPEGECVSANIAAFEGEFPGGFSAVDHDPFADSPLARVVASTESQREVWLADQLSRESSLAYNESVSLRLRGPLDVPALLGALQALVDRHDALRATFGSDGKTLCIAEALTLDITPVALDGPAPERRNEVVAEALRDEVNREFDLEHGPLLRARLFSLQTDDHLLVLTAHHIVCDGWSYGVLVKDLGRLYACQLGLPVELAAAVSFTDYALAQMAREGTPEFTADESYWTALFSTAAPMLDLPTDRPRRARRSFASERLDVWVDADLLGQVRKLGARQGASLFSALLGGFAATLQRVCGGDEFVIGVPAAGQSQAGFEGVVGHCVNLLPLRIQVDAARPLTALVAGVQAAMHDAFEHQQYTFGTLLKRLVLTRDPSRLPLVSVMFNLDQALDTAQAGFPGLELGFAGNPRTHETFELFVNAVLDGGGLRLECQYNTDLFDRATVQRWLDGYLALMHGACTNLDHTEHALGDLPIVGGSDRRAMAGWNATAAPFSRLLRVHDLVEAQAARTPGRIAVACGEVRLTYSELDARANQIAHALRERGTAPGSLVGLHLSRSADMLAALLGVLKTGAAYVPLDPTYPGERLAYMARDAGLAAFVSEADLAQALGWPHDRCLLLDADAAHLAAQPVTALQEQGEAIHAELPAYVIYTSGSTGEPKGVVVPHRAVVNFLLSMAREPGLAADDCLVAVTTLSFDIAVTELLLPLTLGARVVLASREEAGDATMLRNLIDFHEASAMQATPATWRLLLDAGWAGRPGFKALCGGEPLSTDLAAQLQARCGSLWNLYGPTETTVWSSCCRVEAGATSIHIGRPIANTAVWVLDERAQLCPVGVPGEIVIGGEGVSLGYLNRPELTAERFVADPFSDAPGALLYHTGDRGRWRADGVIEHLGRIDFQVKVRGYRVEPGEIEASLLADASVSRAVVLAREDRPGDVRLVAYLVGQLGHVLSVAGLRAHLKTTLPDYMVPQHLVVLAAIPLLPNGKVDRKALPLPEASAPVERQFIAPRSATEHTVATAMEAALNLPGVSVHDDFFALGGHSLLAAQLALSLGRALGRRVPLRAVFDAPTIALLAAWVDRSGTAVAALPPSINAHAETGHAPASLMQQRLWFLEQLDPGRLTYNTPSAHRLSGPLDVAALERSFNEMVRRQAVLRSAVVGEAGVPVQRILATLSVSLLPLDDLSAFAAVEREEALMALLQRRVSQRIDMGEAPLFRVGLYRLAEQEHVLFFMPHHAIWDGWSFDLFYEEMAVLYAAYSMGCEPALKPLAVSYADFSAWQLKWLQSNDLKAQLGHWKALLADLPEPLDLPLDRPRPVRMSGDGGTHPVAWPLDLTERARDLGLRHNATLFMTLLAVYALLLSRLSGQHDIIIGTPMRGRDTPQTAAIMGFFVNALPLRLRIDPAQSFVDLLAQVRSVVLDGFSAPDVPFEHLVRELNVARDESRSPIYQAFFSFQDARQRTRRWGVLQQEQVQVFQPGAAEDLGLWFLEHPQGLAGGLSFNADVFEPGTAARLAERFESLMVSVLASPRQEAGQLACIAAGESALLAEWNHTDAAWGSAPSVASLLQTQAERTPDRVALRSGAATFTYAELEARANRLAHELRAWGIARGSLVGLCLDRSVDMLVALLAILKSGAAYVPLDPAYPADRLAYMAQDAALALLVTHSSLAGTLPWARERSLWLDADAALLGARPEAPLVPDAKRDAAAPDPAYVIYTSGSTGKPKGVVVPHGAVLNFLASMAREPGMVPDDRLLAVTTLSFDIAVLELLLPLSMGSQVVLASREQAQDGRALRALLDTSGATVMQATPSTWRMLVDAGWRGGPGFKALVGGEALPVDLASALLERCGALWNMYGPTETTVWSTCWSVEAPLRRIFIGRPIANTQVHILDAQGQRCGIGVDGEISIAGSGVSLGYLRRPELTAERFIVDPSRPDSRLYRTGDRGRWCADGRLEHLGRLDFQVKLRGHRIELGEIEANLTAHAKVAQALAMVREDRSGDLRLVAYVVGSAPMPSAQDLRDHLRLSLPDYMLPQHIVPIDCMPLLPNGKIDRKALPVPSESSPALVAPAKRKKLGAAEHAVAEIWQDLLGIDDVRADDNFFDLGGHSLLAMRVVMEIEKRLGLRVGVRRLIYESLAQIAATPNDALPDASKLVPSRMGLLSRVLGRFGPRR